MARDPKTYAGAESTVTWDPKRCIHAAECVRGSAAAFDPERRPWIDPDAVPRDELARIVARCPTEALRVEGFTPDAPATNEVTLAPNGPLYCAGDLVVAESRHAHVALCRCGASSIKPYCDGTHQAADFVDAGGVNSDPAQAAAPSGPLKITPAPDGPLLLDGPFTLRAASGRVAARATKAALCRCGASENRPYCDGAHVATGFEG